MRVNNEKIIAFLISAIFLFDNSHVPKICRNTTSGNTLRPMSTSSSNRVAAGLKEHTPLFTPKSSSAGEAQAEEIRKYITDLESGDLDVRSSAASALGNIGPVTEDVIPALIKALGDEDSGVRRSAASALGKIGPVTNEVIPALIKALGDEEWHGRSSAASALGNIGKAAVPALIKALGDEERYVVRESAAFALGKIGKAAVPALIKALGDEDSGIRSYAASALGNIGPEAAPAAIALIEASVIGIGTGPLFEELKGCLMQGREEDFTKTTMALGKMTRSYFEENFSNFFNRYNRVSWLKAISEFIPDKSFTSPEFAQKKGASIEYERGWRYGPDEALNRHFNPVPLLIYLPQPVVYFLINLGSDASKFAFACWGDGRLYEWRHADYTNGGYTEIGVERYDEAGTEKYWREKHVLFPLGSLRCTYHAEKKYVSIKPPLSKDLFLNLKGNKGMVPDAMLYETLLAQEYLYVLAFLRNDFSNCALILPKGIKEILERNLPLKSPVPSKLTIEDFFNLINFKSEFPQSKKRQKTIPKTITVQKPETKTFQQEEIFSKRHARYSTTVRNPLGLHLRVAIVISNIVKAS